MAGADSELADVMLRHLAEIANGRCSITEDQLLAETDPKVQQILMGLLCLHEDLDFRQREWERTSTSLRAKTDAVESALRDLSSMQDALVRSSRMAAVGQLAAGVAHEINNPLAVILGFAQGLERRAREQDAFRLPASSIVREVLRCRSLIQDLLMFSRSTKTNTTMVDVNAVVRSSACILQPRAKAQGVEIAEELGNDIPAVQANELQLEQALVHLGTNALDAMKAGGLLVMRTRRGESHEVCVEVADTGSGIPDAIRPRIFDPFFTTKDVGQGTGLGLSLVHEIIQQHDGRIVVLSEAGKGTSMIVRLPAHRSVSTELA